MKQRSDSTLEADRLLTCAEMARADQYAIAAGVPGLELMERAGQAVASVAIDMAPPGSRVIVLCGPGNNGGDGFVAARALQLLGREVVVGLSGDLDRLTGDAAEMARRYIGGVCPLTPELVDGADLFVDAVFGAGLSRPIATQSDVGALFEAIAASRVPVLAVDVPSGLEGDSGQAEGAVLQATSTVTFFRRKPGHLLLPGRQLCGEVIVADIGIPPTVLHVDDVLAGAVPVFSNNPKLWGSRFPKIDVGDHKYRRGHAVVVSGGIGMSGAARLAARAALRIGSGLVTVAAPLEAVPAHASQLNAILLEAIHRTEDLGRLLSDVRKNAVVVGPGLGRGEAVLEQVMAVLSTPAAVVLDADALTVSGDAADHVFAAIRKNAGRPVVLTPHAGEFSRLFGGGGDAASGNKLERVRDAARRSDGVVVLKGADTVIAAPDGRAAINENAPPWLATAGSGDVLSGMIGGLLAQGMPAFEAACAAVWLHGAAANSFGRGLIAEDIVEELPALLQGDLFSRPNAG